MQKCANPAIIVGLGKRISNDAFEASGLQIRMPPDPRPLAYTWDLHLVFPTVPSPLSGLVGLRLGSLVLELGSGLPGFFWSGLSVCGGVRPATPICHTSRRMCERWVCCAVLWGPPPSGTRQMPTPAATNEVQSSESVGKGSNLNRSTGESVYLQQHLRHHQHAPPFFDANPLRIAILQGEMLLHTIFLI